ncbi:putative hydrolase [Actinacidiphila reveromycinica]|uniref:Putative hydrolase n=1 Tax=Actinacidiphila reveromycinica TaxID=659352 RepID=A0A7U3UMV7_9ACTN|nr:alpha/beta hydrolase [Streptomyces sp. SN-593]BBA95474.1 putative hydrolase [Streptomyces sp. SN-593]
MKAPASTSGASRTSGNPVGDLPLPDLAGFAHRWVDADGVRLHAVEGGRPDGPAVVLLAGFPQTWWAWHKVIPKLADRFRVLAIDLPGQGHSERPDISYDTHTVAAHVHAAVEALGVRTYWLAAHDIGAWVAFSLALKHPGRLRGLALLDAGIPGITLPDAVPTDPALAWKTWHFAFHLVPDLPEVLLTGREREYVRSFLEAKALSSDAFDDADVERYAASVAAGGGLSASLAYYRHAAESARANRRALERRRLAVPVLGISGSHGSIPDMAASVRPWADHVTGTVVPQAGHFIPDEQPGAVAAALTAFATEDRHGKRPAPKSPTR